MSYNKAGIKDAFHARRQQVPIVAGFACTVHNSQSLSLDNGVSNALHEKAEELTFQAILHPESCSTAAAVYVLFSRMKCGSDGPKGMRIMGSLKLDMLRRRASQEARREKARLEALDKESQADAVERLKWYTEATGLPLLHAAGEIKSIDD